MNIELNNLTGRPIHYRYLKTIAQQVFKLMQVEKAIDLSIALIDNKKMRYANRRYLGRNQSTDVLSFSFSQRPLVGEILLCYDYLILQARKEKVSLKEKLTRSLIHGLLHLIGYDHRHLAEAELMAKLETNLWQKIVS